VQRPAEGRVARWRPRLTLRVRFALMMVMAVTLIGGVHRFYLDTRILSELEGELELRTLSFAHHLCAESLSLILNHDVVALDKLLNDAQNTYSDIAYVFILDPRDKVLGHTFESDFPEQLKVLNRYREPDGHQVRRVEIFGEEFRDLAVPVYRGQLGVLRIGVRDRRILSRVTSTRRDLNLLVFAVLALSATMAYLWTDFSLRPLAAITSALERFEPGRHHEKIVPRRDDEIGDLARKINMMTARLHDSHERMMQTEKMVAAGLMASGIAHEINNPISGLQNCLRRIQARPDDVEQIREYTALMLHATEHVEAVVQSLLNFSRSAPKQVDVIDLREVVQQALSLSEFRLGKNRIDLQQATPAAPVWVRGDERQLIQVVVNVVLNAIDAMPAGGVLRVAVEREDGSVALNVRDNGVGIPREHLSRVFEPFFTTKDIGKGTGLGLAVTQGIVLDHDGRISMDSRPGSGTEVKILLPLWTAEEEPVHGSA